MFDVELVIMPAQEASRSEDGVAVAVDGQSLFRMNVELSERGLRLVAQLHTHPGEAYHSDTDDRYSIVTARGGLSIVVPNFARDELRLEECAVYRLVVGGEWVQLSRHQLASLLHLEARG